MKTRAFHGSHRALLASAHPPSLRQARQLQRGIEDVSSLRYTLAHEHAHLELESQGPNLTRTTAILGVLQWLALARIGDQPGEPSIDAVPASARLVQNQITGHDFVRLPGPQLLLAFREDVLARAGGSTFLRFLDGILAALRLMLVLVLAALSRHPDALTFVLVILAACLRYGRRSEPANHTFLPPRRYQTSLGSCPVS
jgi:hypothetical protein